MTGAGAFEVHREWNNCSLETGFKMLCLEESLSGNITRKNGIYCELGVIF